MVKRMAGNDGIVSRYMDDPEFQRIAFERMTEDIFKEINTTS